MKRHRIWYKRELFKNHFKSYKDWDKFNPPSGDKQIGRYKTDALQCKNPDCSREGMLISEHEAFYCFAKQTCTVRIYKKITRIINKKSESNSIYSCPFCGKNDIGEM